MSNTLNFNNIKKQYFTVTLADEKNTTIMIGMPTKAVLNELMSMQTELSALENNPNDSDAIDELFRVCAKVMSRNKLGRQITPDFLEDVFDLEDVMTFFSAYMDFVTKVGNSKN